MTRPPVMSAERKTLIVVSILRGEVTMADAARREGVSQTSIAKWRAGSLSVARPRWRPRSFISRKRRSVRSSGIFSPPESWSDSRSVRFTLWGKIEAR